MDHLIMFSFEVCSALSSRETGSKVSNFLQVGYISPTNLTATTFTSSFC